MDPGDPLLVRTENGPTVRCGDLYLYPPEDPMGYALRRAGAAQAPPRSLLFVPSVGLGHGLARLLSRLSEGSAILCVESDQRVMALAAEQGLPRDERLVVVRTSLPEAAAAALLRMGPGRFRRVVRVALSAGYRLDPGLYDNVFKALSGEIVTYWRNRVTLIGLGSLWVRNLYANLPELPQAIDFARLSTDRPVLVAGAGPSLEAVLPLLRKVRGRLTLVAVDTALPALAAQSITPDLVVVLEAQAANLRDFLPYRGPEVPVACELSSHPWVPRAFAGRVAFFSSGFAPLSLFGRLDAAGLLPSRFPPLGSVGVAAVYAALRLSRGEVFVAGLDFGYPGGKTHARGTPFPLAMLAAAGRLKPVGQEAYAALSLRPLVRETGKDGALLLTDGVLKSYRDQLLRCLGADAPRVHDAGPTGLPLGMDRVSLSELDDRLAGGTQTGERLQTGGKGPHSPGAVHDFLRDEKKLLDGAADILARLAATGTGRLTADETGALEAVRHAFIHFPDEPDLSKPGRSFAARAAVAVRYYAQRLGRLSSVL